MSKVPWWLWLAILGVAYTSMLSQQKQSTGESFTVEVETEGEIPYARRLLLLRLFRVFLDRAAEDHEIQRFGTDPNYLQSFVDAYGVTDLKQAIRNAAAVKCASSE